MRTPQEIRKDLKLAQDRFLEVMRKGDAAVSGCDLSMGYDADYYLNRGGLLRNHVIYYARELREALKYGEQISLF